MSVDGNSLQLGVGATWQLLPLGQSGNNRDHDLICARLQHDLKHHRIWWERVVGGRRRGSPRHQKIVDGDEEPVVPLLLLERREGWYDLEFVLVRRNVDCKVLLCQLRVSGNL